MNPGVHIRTESGVALSRPARSKGGGWTALADMLAELWPVLLATYAPTVAAVGALGVVSFGTGVEFSYFTRDATEILEAPFYSGLLSNIGVLVWWSGSTISLFGGAVALRTARGGEWGRFLLCSGLLTGWLALDDLFTLHEIVIPAYLYIPDIWPLSAPQKLTIALYGAVVLLYLIRFRRAILKTDYLLLIPALGFFGLSVFFDGVGDWIAVPGHHYFEDGAKLMGITGWTVYHIRTACQGIRMDGEPS
jgi:hypothetical protein